jgi:hypothetical protein
VHLALAVFWFGPAMVLALCTSLGDSVVFISFLSVYALGAAHLAAWAGESAAVAAEDAADHAKQVAAEVAAADELSE